MEVFNSTPRNTKADIIRDLRLSSGPASQFDHVIIPHHAGMLLSAFGIGSAGTVSLVPHQQ